uniref:DUF1771 domain-containing protein n=1 Tax=Kalanchoe fedtschenkoi TaxID=63787 RepID=A0A7N0TJK0_KALFE
MEPACANAMGRSYDDKALEGLFDAFGTAFSLKEIASAYCQAGKDADLAAELLYKSDGGSPFSAASGSSSDTRSVDSLDGSFVMVRSKSNDVNGNMKKTKHVWRPVSTGTVSGKLGKDYVSSTPLTNGSSFQTKPLKVESRPSPTSHGHQSSLGSAKEDDGLKEMEDFLFDLLGVGFKLDRSQIRTVLGQCGYDIHRSMRELLNISTENSERNCRYTNRSTGKYSRNSVPEQRRQSGLSGGTRDVNSNKTEPSDAFKSKIDREMEVLAALFTPSERPPELQRRNRTVKDLARSEAAVIATDPAEGSNLDSNSDSISSQNNDEDDAELEADSFEVLRRAVKDYMATKMEYYRAAVEAHAEGHHARAAKFLEQGEFFHQKARQADEESVLKIFEIRPNVKTHDTLTLDLHECDGKEAIRLLKCHLPMLSAFTYLKLIVDTNDKDITRGSRKRRVSLSDK